MSTAEQPPGPTPPRRAARERLLEAADRLFYADGVQSVGIDRVIEEAGVARASMYKSFRSKDALIEAYLKRRHEGTMTRLAEALEAVDDPREKVLAVFDVQADVFAAPDFNGCAFTDATAEAPEGSLIDQAAADYRADMREMFLTLARGVGAVDPTALARQLHLLYDGGITIARMDRDPAIAQDSRATAALLVDVATR